MRLRSRIILFAEIAVVLVAVVVATPLIFVNRMQQNQLDALMVEDYRSTWTTALAAAGSAMLLQGAGSASPFHLPDNTQKTGVAIERVDSVDQNLKLTSSTVAGNATHFLVNPEIMLREVSRAEQVIGLALSGNNPTQPEVWFVGSRALPQGGFITVASRPSVLVNFLKNGIAGDFYITDTAGALLASSNATLWKSVRPYLQQETGVTKQNIAGTLYSIAAMPVNDYTGYRIGSFYVMQDVASTNRQEFLLIVALGFASLMLLGVLAVILHFMLSGALQPLADVSRTIRAIARGDIFIPVHLQTRDDEVADLANAVGVFQNHALALAQRDFAEQVDQISTRQLIDAEMHKITQVLEPDEQKALQADLQQVLHTPAKDDATLALSFQLVTARVVDQQARLSHVLAERSADLMLVRKALEERTQLNRLLEELALASQLQSASLPRPHEALKLLPWIDLHAQMRPAKEVGGDFYDYLMLDDRHLMLVVGDASGKGISAAMFVLMTRTLLRANVSLQQSPAQSLFATNNALERDNQAMIFTTVFLGILDLHTGQLNYANAGHNPPYIIHANGHVQRLDGAAGVMLGVMPDFEYRNAATVLVPGDCMLMYSDGITEAHNPNQTLYGEDNMVQVLKAHAASGSQALVTQLFAQVDVFADSAEQFDDMTVLAYRFQCNRNA